MVGGRWALWMRAACQALRVGVNTEHHQPLLLEQQTKVNWDWELEEKEHFP